MKKWDFRISLVVSAGVLALVIARCCVSLGRLIYTVQTGIDVIGGDTLPTWYGLLLSDGFFYVGLLALPVCIVSAVMCTKKK